jgi:hypothetical protein
MKTREEKLQELRDLIQEGMNSPLKDWNPQEFLNRMLEKERELGIDVEEEPKRKTPMSEWVDGEDEELDWTKPEFVPTRMKVFEEADYSGGEDE